MTLEGQDRISAVTVRMWDRELEEVMWTYDLTTAQIAQGRYTMPEFDLGASEFAQKHWDQLMAGYMPEPVLQVIYTAKTENGEETFTEEAEAAYELWVSGRYDLKDPEEDFLHSFMEQTTYPDCFVVRIEDTPFGEIRMSYGEGEELEPGDVSVILKADGKILSGDGWHMEKTETVYDEGTFYAYALVVPRPADLPEHGSIELTVTRRLIHYPTQTTEETKTIEY